jgi:hypothetical protein
MRRIPFLICAVFMGMFSIPLNATSYTGHVTGFWVEVSGDITWYALDAKDKYGNLPACPGLFRLPKAQKNFVELYTSLLLATKQNYFVSLESTSCVEGNKSVIDAAKICTPRLKDCY